MPFSITKQPNSDFELITIANERIAIEICTKGGLLNKWELLGSTNVNFIDGNEFSSGWNQFEMNGFKSGKMNPYSCRLKNGKYFFESKSYQIENFYLGNHALHGIVYDALYTIVSTDIKEDEASVTLSYQYNAFDKGFPFHYSIQLQWIITNTNTVKSITTIQNNGLNDFPMMDGWHPYFKLSENINKYRIQFNNKGRIVYDSELLPTGEMIQDLHFENGAVLNNMHLDNCYLLQENSSVVIEDEKYKLTIRPGKQYPYLQLYTPENRSSIAIENLSGVPDCFNNKMGLHVMKPHAQLVLDTSYTIEVK
jgi:aldose 1-epimerase